MAWKLILPQLSSPSVSQDIFPIVDNMQKILLWFFLKRLWCFLLVIVALVGVVVGCGYGVYSDGNLNKWVGLG